MDVYISFIVVFFFQAEDGIRAATVTGVQTCALPISIEGLPPDLTDLPSGCAFHPRCPFRIGRCLQQAPALLPVGSTQRAACWVTQAGDRKSTRLNSSHGSISYAVFCLKKKKERQTQA